MSLVTIENVEIAGWKTAFRGMRNPKNSWERSDSDFSSSENIILGKNDLTLATSLIKAGTEHRKFLRMIYVGCDFILPYYVVQEFDTYKIGTTRNSCSFMHKGTAKEFDESDFLLEEDDLPDSINESIEKNIDTLNKLRKYYLETKDVVYFRLLRQLLPAGYKVRFTWSGNYEILLNIYKQRKNHRLQEWHEICDWIETLPYMKEFIEAAVKCK